MKKVNYIDVNGKSGEVSIDKLSFRPSVYGIIIKDGKVLLIKQHNFYSFPGGGIEIDETVEKALKREMLEETGLKVDIKEIIDCRSSFFFANMVDEYWNGILIYYLCENISGQLSVENFDKNEQKYSEMAEWIDLNDIENIKFHKTVNGSAIIEKALKIIKNRE
jgi:ADP-ribose pyrophosphatase YjhB (NUDIX family)